MKIKDTYIILLSLFFDSVFLFQFCYFFLLLLIVFILRFSCDWLCQIKLALNQSTSTANESFRIYSDHVEMKIKEKKKHTHTHKYTENEYYDKAQKHTINKTNLMQNEYSKPRERAPNKHMVSQHISYRTHEIILDVIICI